MSGGEYDYVAISVEPQNISVIPASLQTPEIFHLNAKSPDALMLAGRFPFPRRTRWLGSWGSRPTTAGAGKRYYAFKTISEQLGDYVLVRQVAGVTNQTFGVQAFLFRGKRNYKLVIWNINGEQRILRIEGGLQDAKVVNVFGRPIQLERNKSGAARISFGAAPVYISGVHPYEAIQDNIAQAGATPMKSSADLSRLRFCFDACRTKKGESSYASRGTDFEPPYRISEARCTAGTRSP